MGYLLITALLIKNSFNYETAMKRTQIGYSLPISTVGEQCHAFVPHPLPPQQPLQIIN